MPYFARGLNVAKAAVLFPFSVFGPLLLFLIRKDRVVCGNCKALLPGEVHIPLGDTFNPSPRSLEAHAAGAGPPAGPGPGREGAGQRRRSPTWSGAAGAARARP